MSSQSFLLGALAGLLIACSSNQHAGPPSQANDTGSIGDGPGATCIGPKPPASAWSATPGPVVATPDGGDAPDAADAEDAVADAAGDASVGDGDAPAVGPTTPGSVAPVYALNDFQPQSCGFKAVYGLPPFKGKVTVAALLAGW